MWCFDTSAFIEPWRRHYPPEIATELWDLLSDMWQDGDIVVPEEVYIEVQKFDDDIHSWIKERRYSLRKPCEKVEEKLISVMTTHPELVSIGKGRSGGDPWMIATAWADDLALVSYEGFAGKKTKVKIPNVCRDLNIECIQFGEFLKQAGIYLGASRL